jgi:hypothetical protein
MFLHSAGFSRSEPQRRVGLGGRPPIPSEWAGLLQNQSLCTGGRSGRRPGRMCTVWSGKCFLALVASDLSQNLQRQSPLGTYKARYLLILQSYLRSQNGPDNCRKYLYLTLELSFGIYICPTSLIGLLAHTLEALWVLHRLLVVLELLEAER